MGASQLRPIVGRLVVAFPDRVFRRLLDVRMLSDRPDCAPPPPPLFITPPDAAMSADVSTESHCDRERPLHLWAVVNPQLRDGAMQARRRMRAICGELISKARTDVAEGTAPAVGSFIAQQDGKKKRGLPPGALAHNWPLLDC